MLISKIQKCRRERNRFEVYVDEQPLFKVSDTVLVQLGLYTGQEIDEKIVEQAVLADSLESARRLAITFLSYRPRTCREIIGKLTTRGYSPEVANQVLDKLREFNMVNDLEFARMFVRDKLRGKPMGKAMMRKKLQEKGVSFQLADRVIREYMNDESEQQAALVLAEKKLKASGARYASLDTFTRQKRIAAYLLTRGFSAEIAHKIARSVSR